MGRIRDVVKRGTYKDADECLKPQLDGSGEAGATLPWLQVYCMKHHSLQIIVDKSGTAMARADKRKAGMFVLFGFGPSLGVCTLSTLFFYGRPWALRPPAGGNRYASGHAHRSTTPLGYLLTVSLKFC